MKLIEILAVMWMIGGSCFLVWLLYRLITRRLDTQHNIINAVAVHFGPEVSHATENQKLVLQKWHLAFRHWSELSFKSSKTTDGWLKNEFCLIDQDGKYWYCLVKTKSPNDVPQILAKELTKQRMQQVLYRHKVSYKKAFGDEKLDRYEYQE